VPFPKKLLNANESVLVDLRPHWWYLAEATAALVGALILAGFALSKDSDVLTWISVIVLVVAFVFALQRFVRWSTTNFVITSDRVVFRQGVIAKSGVQIPLERVNNVNFHQGIFERMIGAGDLLIESAGEAGQQRFTDIKHPDAVTNLLHEAMEAKEIRRHSPGATTVQSPDVVGQIERLEGLLQRGSISQEEYEAQKQKLLGG